MLVLQKIINNSKNFAKGGFLWLQRYISSLNFSFSRMRLRTVSFFFGRTFNPICNCNFKLLTMWFMSMPIKFPENQSTILMNNYENSMQMWSTNCLVTSNRRNSMSNGATRLNFILWASFLCKFIKSAIVWMLLMIQSIFVLRKTPTIRVNWWAIVFKQLSIILKPKIVWNRESIAFKVVRPFQIELVTSLLRIQFFCD